MTTKRHYPPLSPHTLSVAIPPLDISPVPTAGNDLTSLFDILIKQLIECFLGISQLESSQTPSAPTPSPPPPPPLVRVTTQVLSNVGNGTAQLGNSFNSVNHDGEVFQTVTRYI